MKDYKLHELCSLFPRMSDFDLACLKLDIQKHGQQNPIILHDGKIIDGQNRHLACKQLGIDPIFTEYDGDDIASYVLSVNLHRRHLTPGQQAVIVASVQDWGKAQKVGSPQSTNASRLPADTLGTRADKSGVSKSTQQKADAVAKASPELAAQVARGEVSLEAATREVAPQLARKKNVEPPPEKPTVKEALTVDGDMDEVLKQLDEDNNAESPAQMLGRQNEMLRESNHALNEEIVNLRDKKLTDGNVELEKTLFDLRQRVKMLEVTLDVITKSRDQYINENAQLKRQNKLDQSRIKKLEKQIGIAPVSI